MTSISRRRIFGCVPILILGLVLVAAAQNQTRQQPPEVKDLTAAFRIQDPAARLKEFERIKAAFPNSQYLPMIEQNIFGAKIEMAATLDSILALQKELLARGKGSDRLQNPFMAADQIVNHPRAMTFDKARVIASVLKYREDAIKAAGEAETFQGVPADQQKEIKAYIINGFQILLAGAHLAGGDAPKAMAALDAYRKDGGAADAVYSYALGGVNEKMNKPKEAFEAYLVAATDKYGDAAAKAKALYAKLNGKTDGFEAVLEAKLRELPYRPEPFKAPAGWKGKTVLAEIFTGSECPPCVAADLGFDGLIEAYPAPYLAVLEYHLPIPRPDPMINGASQVRQIYYGVNSTPMTFFDGESKLGGGGSRGMAEGKFKAYKTEIDGRLAAAPAVIIKAKTTRTGDLIKVEWVLDKAVPGAEINVVLAQNAEKFAGSNGIVFHKMVVREVAVLPVEKKSVAFNLALSEKAADDYLTSFEKTNTRFQGFKFPDRHAKIARQGLRIVVFAQDKATKKVLNAAVVDVK
jgi:hypothetical protein